MTAIALAATCRLAAAMGMPIAPGYRPFLDPLPVDDIWMLLMAPLVVAISLVYKAIKIEDLTQLTRQTAALVAQILAFMVIAAGALWLLAVLL